MGTDSILKKADEEKSAEDNHSFDLKGIVVHYGSGMHYGHYWSLARSPGPNSKWIEYDDNKLRVVDDREVQMYYGSPPDTTNSSSWSCAYMLLYQSQELTAIEEIESEK